MRENLRTLAFETTNITKGVLFVFTLYADVFCHSLTHRGQHKVAEISLTTFWIKFCLFKFVVVLFKFHWNIFSMVQLTLRTLTHIITNLSRLFKIARIHDDVIKWKHFPRNWPFVRKIHRSPVNFPHKGQWRGALMFSLIYVWINDWANNREAGDLRRQHGHYDVIVM